MSTFIYVASVLGSVLFTALLGAIILHVTGGSKCSGLYGVLADKICINSAEAVRSFR